MTEEKNVKTVEEVDKEFIRTFINLPKEKKLLVKGVIVGIHLQNQQMILNFQ